MTDDVADLTLRLLQDMHAEIAAAVGHDADPAIFPAGTSYIGARSLSLNDADTAVHAWGYCFYVDNGSADSIFVPFQQPERDRGLRRINALVADILFRYFAVVQITIQALSQA